MQRGCLRVGLPMICLLLNVGLAAEVQVREVSMEIPTYLIGPENKYPVLWNSNVYPYSMQDDITRIKQDVAHRVIVLENEYIRVLILPDLGGRLYAAHDKTNNDFDFIYHNHVIKPGLVAMRGAWLSGGIEWNFPTVGHTVNGYSPVQYKIVRHEDGSATCVVGATEWVRRMRWVIETTLYPDRAYFENRILLINPTLAHQPAYFWANAGVHAWEDTRIIFPPTDYTYGHGRTATMSWPIDKGIDVSWYKNIPNSASIFCGVPGDFNGAYNHERDNGTAHWADRHESPGKKFWTWGTAPRGALWEEILTDDDGQYIEVQAGRLTTQGDAWIMEPNTSESWTEYWYPLKGMGGFVTATPDAAANLQVRDDHVFVALNVTRPLAGARLQIFRGSDNVFDRSLDMNPTKAFSEKIPLAKTNAPCRLVVIDAQGRTIVEYSTETPASPPPDLEPVLSSDEADSDQPDHARDRKLALGSAVNIEDSYLRSYSAHKHFSTEGAITGYEATLRKDPNYTPALRELGVIRYTQGQFGGALELLNKVLQRNEDDDKARYYRALCKIQLGIEERTQEDLHMAGRRTAYRHVAPYVLAGLAVGEGDLVKAENLLRRAVRYGPDNLKARVQLAVVLRHRGMKDEATSLLDTVLRDDPLCSQVVVEKVFLGSGDELDLLRDDPQNYLETACDYAEMNLFDDAIAVLDLYEKRKSAMPHPFIHLYRGYYHDRLGRREETKRDYERAVSMSPDYVFPFRIESLAVLESALARCPNEWELHYYLGNLLTAKLRWEEGLVHFEKAAEADPKYSVLYRNLGEVYWRKQNDLPKAIAQYEKALGCAPEDYSLYMSLDALYAETKQHDKRAAMMAVAPEKVRDNFNIALRQAVYNVDVGNYDEALRILRGRTYHPWEGWRGARQAYRQALHGRAERFLEQGRGEEAIKDFLAAMEYPKNLGTGRPPNPNFVKEYYGLARCYKALKDDARTREYLEKAAAGAERMETEDIRLQAKALKELGRAGEAEEVLKKAGLKDE